MVGSVPVFFVFYSLLHTFVIAFQELKDELHQQRDMYAELLDSATDGFCTVEASGQGGRFVGLSQKLQQTLCTSGEESCNIAGSVPKPEEAERILAHTCGAVQQPGQDGPRREVCIVTCVAPPRAQREVEQVEFEVRVFPFWPRTGRLQMCFQVASERRRVQTVQGSRSSSEHSSEEISGDEDTRGLETTQDEDEAEELAGLQPRPPARQHRASLSELSWQAGSDDGSLTLSVSTAAVGVCRLCRRHVPLTMPTPMMEDRGVQTEGSVRPPVPPAFREREALAAARQRGKPVASPRAAVRAASAGDHGRCVAHIAGIPERSASEHADPRPEVRALCDLCCERCLCFAHCLCCGGVLGARL